MCTLDICLFYVYFKYMFAAELFFFHPMPVLDSVLFYCKETVQNSQSLEDTKVWYILQKYSIREEQSD